MDEQQKEELLDKAKTFFRDNIGENHVANTHKASKLENFTLNPFLYKYLANYLTGNDDPESIAKALIYPRVLGTSITTSFGSNFQRFMSTVLEGFGSTTNGIDIEYIDQIDNRKKYCQVKSGPRTINKDDITTIQNHFQGVINLARQNNLPVQVNDLTVGVIYGEPEELSTHYQEINRKYPVIVGKDFWHRLTGDEDFYFEMIETIGEVANETDGRNALNDAINNLTDEIRENEDF